ncbi:putative ATP-grasp-modified RiPP [Saccharopolyspora phatthalungensis]|uniref:Putative ATP-grasp target RiPP n=1 Tax=Saccharopolyspora phatthalungensis TaxID=664693 RepID=A0A840Q1A9_9PSEU|nr:putative ATP-grasp-modified RiPP [Saccharopolyspora phatthalungensis]MBB5152529.1 putative ATP-grasp target RiPP [Saccharopolyspora phatthalungensis]
MTSMLTRFGDDPIAPESAQFPLRTDETATAEVVPSETGVRPWGLRRMTTVTPPECAPGPQGTYNPVRQIRVDGDGRPVIVAGPPTAPTTGSQDGSEGDPSEDYHND